jgi:hypothetical protein
LTLLHSCAVLRLSGECGAATSGSSALTFILCRAGFRVQAITPGHAREQGWAVCRLSETEGAQLQGSGLRALQRALYQSSPTGRTGHKCLQNDAGPGLGLTRV